MVDQARVDAQTRCCVLACWATSLLWIILPLISPSLTSLPLPSPASLLPLLQSSLVACAVLTITTFTFGLLTGNVSQVDKVREHPSPLPPRPLSLGLELGTSPLLPPHPPHLLLPSLPPSPPPCFQLGRQADLQLLEKRGIFLASVERRGRLQVVHLDFLAQFCSCFFEKSRWDFVRQWPVLNTRIGWHLFHLGFICVYQVVRDAEQANLR